MIILLVPFLVLAALGFALSVAAHVIALTGQMPPGGDLVMGLHAGIFIVWIPTVLVMIRVTRGVNRRDTWKIALSGCPMWMRYTLYGLFAYAILNFVIFAATSKSTNHGLAAITPETIRGFSGHWMVFYGAAFSTLLSVIRSPDLLKARKCPNGHDVGFNDVFCPICGRALQRTGA